MEVNITNISFSSDQFSLPRSVEFSLIFIVNIPSTQCSFLLLYHLFTKRSLRPALHNHMIIVLLLAILIVQLIDMPLYLKYLYLGFVSPQTTAMCIIWWYIDTIVILLAWASFERHILIFHYKLISTRKKLWLFHLFVLLIPSCDEKYLFDYTQGWCNYNPCYYNIQILNLYDTLMNAAIPCFLTALFSIILVIRVLWTQYIRFHRPIQWRKYRKITIQSFFVVFNLPLEVCGSLPTNVNEEILPFFLFSANFSVLLLPFVIIFFSTKEILEKTMAKN